MECESVKWWSPQREIDTFLGRGHAHILSPNCSPSAAGLLKITSYEVWIVKWWSPQLEIDTFLGRGHTHIFSPNCSPSATGLLKITSYGVWIRKMTVPSTGNWHFAKERPYVHIFDELLPLVCQTLKNHIIWSVNPQNDGPLNGKLTLC